MIYQERKYRSWIRDGDLVRFEVKAAQTDLLISAERDLGSRAMDAALRYRRQIEEYIKIAPQFERSLEPIDVGDRAPSIIKDMARAGYTVGVGPMAAVAGAIAEYVGRDLLKYSKEVIVENGGDIFIKSLKPRTIGIYAGQSPLSGKIAIEISAKHTPLGICTSSGTVGHSLSYGKADSVTILAKSAVIADALATAVGNSVRETFDIEKGIELARSLEKIEGIMIIVGERLGSWGNIKIIRRE